MWISHYREPKQLFQIWNWLKYSSGGFFVSLFVSFFPLFTNVLPGLFTTPRCHLENQDLHVNRTLKSTFWVSRGSRCEDRSQALPILTSVPDVRNCGLKQNPNQTSQLGSSFCVTWWSTLKRSFANMLSQTLSLKQGKMFDYDNN